MEELDSKDQLTISIHALREEGDEAGRLSKRHLMLFLSTPSARRATTLCRPMWSDTGYFYPRPPRGGRPAAGCAALHGEAISIHALREEGDSGTGKAGSL